MMTGGIDSVLNNRVAAGRQDPQYLTNSYQKNQDLLDLLALQKLKSEKEAAKRQMLLQGGGTPPTVREQREQELVSMNKQELAEQVGGAAQQQMAQQQQAMQRLMSGIGGQSAPAFADGGIVGYQEGGGVEEQYDVTALVEEATKDNSFPRELVQWAKDNPYDAVSMGLVAVPGIGIGANLLGRGIAGLTRLGGAAAPGAGRGLSKLFTKAAQGPKGSTMPVLAGARQFDPMRAAGVVGTGMYGAGQIADMMTGGSEEPIADAPTGIAAALPQPTAREPGFRMQGVSDRPAMATSTPAQPRQMDTMTRQEIATGLANNPAQYLQMAGGTPSVQPASQEAGIGALAQQIQDLQSRRGDKWSTFADWATSVAGADRNEMGQALAAGAQGLKARDKAFDDELLNLLKTQQGMQLAEREMGVAEREAMTEEARVAALEAANRLEADLTREGWDRDDARAAATNQSRVIEAYMSQGLDGADAARMYSSIVANMPINADPAEWSNEAMRQTLQAMRLLGGSGGFNIVEELD